MSQTVSIPHLPRVNYFRSHNEFLCGALKKVDLTKFFSFSLVEFPLCSPCSLSQKCFRSCSICKCHNTLLCSRNKGIWSIFCPSHQQKTRMMGPCFCALLRICIRVRLSLSIRFYCCRSDDIYMFRCIALLFLHRDTWRLPLPLLCKTTGPLTLPCCRSCTLFFLVLGSHIQYPWHLRKHSKLFIQL